MGKGDDRDVVRPGQYLTKTDFDHLKRCRNRGSNRELGSDLGDQISNEALRSLPVLVIQAKMTLHGFRTM